jgi:hypothetical protein
MAHTLDNTPTPTPAPWENSHLTLIGIWLQLGVNVRQRGCQLLTHDQIDTLYDLYNSYETYMASEDRYRKCTEKGVHFSMKRTRQASKNNDACLSQFVTSRTAALQMSPLFPRRLRICLNQTGLASRVILLQDYSSQLITPSTGLLGQYIRKQCWPAHSHSFFNLQRPRNSPGLLLVDSPGELFRWTLQGTTPR